MTQPDPAPLSASARAMLATADGFDPLAGGGAERIWAALESNLAAAAPAPAPSPPAAAANGALALTRSAVAAIALLSAGIGGVAGFAVGNRTQAPPPAVVAAAAMAQDASSQAPALAAPLPQPSVVPAAVPPPEKEREKPARAAPAAPTAPATAPKPAVTLSASERLLVEQARSALARQDLPAAQAALDAHAAQFPHGELVEDADALAVLVRIQRGDDSASDVAASFARAYPKSLYNAAIQRALLGAP